MNRSVNPNASVAHKAWSSCQAAYDAGCSTGAYRIELVKDKPFRELFCYMDDANKAAWTLVWRYGFSNYKSFTSSNNHITTIPNWCDYSDKKKMLQDSNCVVVSVK